MNIHIRNEKKFKDKMKNNNNFKSEMKKLQKKRKKIDYIKKEKNNKFINKISKFNDLLEIPAELRGDKSKITILDFNKIFVENYLNILKYDENRIEILTYSGKLIINGFKLNLNEMNDEDIMVDGKITIVELEDSKGKVIDV